ncbi:hypothetical protein [Telmatospirillum sp.]|uniref:hypothetical protein n=1 Tax=Telmatospirillum sp. TaxID=2079197 RepID=UPI00284ED356|nr:hypothetical protein [Telmatospirillum sp.]MDR3438832.1 hypothetical protein [Telmatospirillum sp.]
MLNNYYGNHGVDEYDITIKATNGDSVTYQSIGGVDTCDYNTNVFTDTIADATTEWFDNGIGQRFDLREFNLPTSFALDTKAGFTITQEHSGDAALRSGLTFSDKAATPFGEVPEPATLTVLGVSLGGWRRGGVIPSCGDRNRSPPLMRRAGRPRVPWLRSRSRARA